MWREEIVEKLLLSNYLVVAVDSSITSIMYYRDEEYLGTEVFHPANPLKYWELAHPVFVACKFSLIETTYNQPKPTSRLEEWKK
jgi:hypothetical protein